MHSNRRIAWHADEYIYREKTADWYWVLGIISVTASVVVVLIGNILFAIIIILSAFTLGLQSLHPPRRIRYEINNKGILIENTLYPYSTLEAFWIDDSGLPSRLLIRSKKVFVPLIVILLEGVRNDGVQSLLAEHLVEEEQVEPVLQKIFEYFGL